MNNEQIDSEKQNDVILASLSDRLAASLLDGFIMIVIMFIPMILFFGFDGFIQLPTQYGITYSIAMLLIGQTIFVFFNGYLLFKYGQTIGKKYMDIKIVTLENKLPSITNSYGLRYFVMALAQLFPIIGNFVTLIDILFIFRKDRRCIHDHLAGTKVVEV